MRKNNYNLILVVVVLFIPLIVNVFPPHHHAMAENSQNKIVQENVRKPEVNFIYDSKTNRIIPSGVDAATYEKKPYEVPQAIIEAYENRTLSPEKKRILEEMVNNGN